MIIDFHTHPLCKEASIVPGVDAAVDRLFADNPENPAQEGLRSTLAAAFTHRSESDIIEEMDRFGIDKGVIVGMDLSTAFGVEMVTALDIQRLTERYPDRFVPFIGIDPAQGQVAIDKLVSAVELMGCRGVKLHPELQGLDFSNPDWFPFWEKCQELGIIVWTHSCAQRTLPGKDVRLAQPMQVEALATRFKRLKIVLGHWGFPWYMDAWAMIYRHPNVYLDISSFHEMLHLFPWEATRIYGCEHKILFATDSPMASAEGTLNALRNLNISDDFRDKVMGENAVALLNI